MIDMFMRRGLFKGTVKDVLARAEDYPLRRIEIGTPKDAQKLVLLYLI
jgi:hypothetical protein